MTRQVTKRTHPDDAVILDERAKLRMNCEFCEAPLPTVQPENLALLQHVRESPECEERFGYLLENLNTSWTKAMSGG